MSRIIIALLCLTFTGCIEVSFHRPESEVNVEVTEDPSELVVGNVSPLQKVQAAFDAIENAEDRLTIHKLFSGAADYLSVCEDLDNTTQFDPILGKVQSSYGWDREKYSNLTDAVSEYLVSVKYDDPKPLRTKSERQQFAKIFMDLSEATKYE